MINTENTMEEIDAKSITQKIIIGPNTLRLKVPFSMSISGPSQSKSLK